jgi:hypothetical protein
VFNRKSQISPEPKEAFDPVLWEWSTNFLCPHYRYYSYRCTRDWSGPDWPGGTYHDDSWCYAIGIKPL